MDRWVADFSDALMRGHVMPDDFNNVNGRGKCGL